MIVRWQEAESAISVRNMYPLNEKLSIMDVYVWIHLSSSGKRNIIEKMLKSSISQ